jgi:DNA-binding NarL/FixJ family response regulator
MHPQAAFRHTAGMQSNTASTQQTPLRIYFVEDSEAIRERLQHAATLAGASSAGYADRADIAIRDILAGRPDMVLLDLQLAEGTGFDVLRALQRKAPGIEVYVVSNNSEEPYRTCAARLGARGFYDKTHDFMRVLDLIATRATTFQH